MPVIITSMLLVLALVAVVVGVVIVGMQGRGADRAPALAEKMAKAARHLNGEGRTPRTFIRVLQRLHLNVQ